MRQVQQNHAGARLECRQAAKIPALSSTSTRIFLMLK
jgi:hypothetical protein